MSVIDILKFVEYADYYPNISNAYIILLTVSMSVASVEKSFSKLNLIKTYLRSSMSKERLNGLTTLLIKKNMLENIDVYVIINDFASQNTRNGFYPQDRSIKPAIFGGLSQSFELDPLFDPPR
jgi:hypothetical protein